MTFRLYFNRCEDWPQIWSIDDGDIAHECNVVAWRTEPGVTMRAGRVSDELRATLDKARQPVAWCEVEAANCRIEAGIAVFYDALSESS